MKRAEAGYFNVFIRDGFKCAYCGKTSIEDGVKLNADHIIPRLLGGNDEANNLITACRDCNAAKAAKRLPQSIIDRLHARIKKRPI